MIHRLTLALFAVLLVLGLNLGAPSVAQAQDVRPTTRVDLRNLPVTGGALILSSTDTFVGGDSTYSRAFHVSVMVAGTNSVFSLDRGTDLAPGAFNEGTELTAGCEYTFTFAATKNDTLNFTCATSTTLARLVVEEIRMGNR